MGTPVEHCANCDAVIGRLETPYVWRDQIVCHRCHAKLRGLQPATEPHARPVAHATPARDVPKPPGGRWIAIIALGVMVGIVGLLMVGGVFTGITSNARSSLANESLSSADRELFAALEHGTIDDVKRALQGEPNLKAVGGAGRQTALAIVIRKIDDLSYYSSSGGKERQAYMELAEKMIKDGADVNRAGSFQTPLYEAKTDWSVKFLLSHGANPNGLPGADPPLFWKSADVYRDAAAALLAGGANPNVANSEGQTPLHKAAAENEKGIVDLLLHYGAQVNARDGKGYTPLRRARMSLQSEAADILQRNGGTE